MRGGEKSGQVIPFNEGGLTKRSVKEGTFVLENFQGEKNGVNFYLRKEVGEMIEKRWKAKWLVIMLISIVTVVMLSGALCFAQGGTSEEYPTKAITLVVAWKPGGGTDTLARTLAAFAGEYLGVPLIVKNRPGATGTIGTFEVAQAKPDGYTLILSANSPITTVPHSRELPYEIPEDFEWICLIADFPCTLSVWTGHPWESVDEVVEYAKKNPGKLTIGHTGTGGLGHAQVLQFEQAAGIDVEDIPFQGTGPSVVAAAGGHIDALVGSFSGARPQIEAGNLRALACISSLERTPLYPDVPTMKELGYDVKVANFATIAAPKGTPQDRINYLVDVFEKIYNDPSWQKLIKKLSTAPRWARTDEAKEIVREEYDSVGKALEKLR